MRAPQYQFLKSSAASNIESAEGQLKAKKEIIDDFIFNKETQDAVLEEMRIESDPNKPQFNQAHTLNAIIEASNDINEMQKDQSSLHLGSDHNKSDQSIGNAYVGGTISGPKLQDLIIKRLNNDQIHATQSGDMQFCARLRFFMQYPPKVR